MAALYALAAGVLARDLRARAERFVANPQVDPLLERGRYLVEGLGHCGACHTPRSLTMQEKALSETEGDDFLAGSSAPVDGWVASSLRGENRDGLGSWSEAELAEFLKTGRNDKSVVFGGMSDVVEHSLQYLSDEDVTAIAHYLKSLPPRRSARPLRRWRTAWRKICGRGDDVSPARRRTSITARPVTVPTARAINAPSRR